MSDTFMFDAAGAHLAPAPARVLAAWAIKPRGPAHLIASIATAAIIRAHPMVLRNLAFLLCAASTAGLAFLVARVLGATA
jgi:hypothetical protein